MSSLNLQVVYTELFFFISVVFTGLVFVYMIRYSDNSFISLCEITLFVEGQIVWYQIEWELLKIVEEKH